jgi:hypothetical protein
MSQLVKKTVLIQCTLIFFVCFPIFANAIDLNSFTDKDHRFSLKYSKEWTIYSADEVSVKTNGALSPSQNAVVFIVNPKNYDQNLNIKVIDGVKENSLDDEQIKNNVNRLDENYPKQIKGFTKISDRIISVDKCKALEYMFKAPRNNDIMVMKQITIVKNGKVFIITCTAKESDFKAVDSKYFGDIINSLKIL